MPPLDRHAGHLHPDRSPARHHKLTLVRPLCASSEFRSRILTHVKAFMLLGLGLSLGLEVEPESKACGGH